MRKRLVLLSGLISLGISLSTVSDVCAQDIPVVENEIIADVNDEELYVDGQENIETGDVLTEGDFTYKVLEDGNISICGYIGEDFECIIPEELAGGVVTSIEAGAFANCEELMTIDLPETITDIGESAFSGCISLFEIVIPVGVTEINNSVFKGCESLMLVEFVEGATITAIGDSAFEGCTELSMMLELPKGAVSIGEKAFCECGNMVGIVIPKSVTEIAADAFDGCPDITVFCIENSYAHQYVVDNEIYYELITDEDAEDEEIIIAAPVLNSVTIVAPGKHVISWNPVEGATGYEIFRIDETGNDGDTIGTVMADEGTVFTDSSEMIPGNVYVYTVNAYYEDDINYAWSEDSNEIRVTATLDKAEVKTRSTSNGVNVIKWTEADKADGYIIMRKSLKSAKWEEYAQVEGGSVVRYEDTAVSADTRYYYTVKAYYNNTFLGEKVYAEFDTDNTGVITSIGTVELTSLSSEAGFNTITWNPIDGVQGYVIKRKTDGGKWINLAVLKGDERYTYTDKKAITAGSDYTYTIFAMGKKKADGSKNYGGFNKNGLTVEASVKTVSVKKAYALQGRNVVTWNKVNGADGYVIMRKTADSSEWYEHDIIENSIAVKYNDTAVIEGNVYIYSVKAYYVDDEGSYVYGAYNETGKSVTAVKGYLDRAYTPEEIVALYHKVFEEVNLTLIPGALDGTVKCESCEFGVIEPGLTYEGALEFAETVRKGGCSGAYAEYRETLENGSYSIYFYLN